MTGSDTCWSVPPMEQSLIPLREVASFTDRRATPCHRWQYMSTVTAPSPRNRVSPCSHLLIGFFFRDVLLDREVGAIYVLSVCAAIAMAIEKCARSDMLTSKALMPSCSARSFAFP